jgi:hypothetical protein
MAVESKGAELVLFVGDDWAEAHHDIEIQDDTGRRLVRRRLSEGMAGVAVLHELIGQHVGQDDGELDDPTQVVVGIETDRGPWVQALLAAGYQVYAINPLSVARYRERHTTSGPRANPGDAKVLADLVRTDRQHHRPIAGDSQLAEAIKVLARAHQGLLDAWPAGQPAALDAAGVLSRRVGGVRRADPRGCADGAGAGTDPGSWPGPVPQQDRLSLATGRSAAQHRSQS